MTTETTAEQVEELTDFEREFMAMMADESEVEMNEHDGDVEAQREPQDAGEQATESQDSKPNEQPEEPSIEQLQAQIDSLTQQRDHYQHGFDANRGRVSALQKKINELESSKPADNNNEQSTGDPVNPEGSGMTDDQWSEFVEEYPEMAAALDAKLNHVTQTINARLDSEVNSRLEQIQVELNPLSQRAHEEHLQSQLKLLNEKHPDWEEVVSSAEFSKWIGEQPEPVQALANSQAAKDAAYVIDTYKALNSVAVQQPSVTNDRKERLQQNLGVKAKGARQAAGVPDDFDSAFDYFSSQSN